MDAKERLSSVNRVNDTKNPKCPVCTDDSLSIATVQVPALEKVTLKQLLDEILPEKLGVLSSKMFVTHGKNIVYERDDELSDEEIYAKRLDRTLASLKLASDSILGL